MEYYCSTEVERPRKYVSIEDILELRALNYNWTKIASMLDTYLELYCTEN